MRTRIIVALQVALIASGCNAPSAAKSSIVSGGSFSVKTNKASLAYLAGGSTAKIVASTF